MQPSTLLQEALSTFEVVAQGQARVLAAQARDVAAETGSAELEAGQVQTPAERGQEDMDTEGSDAGDTSTYTSSLVTPAALLDTLLSMHTCALSLIPMSNSTDEINVAASISSDALRRATEVVNMTPDGEKQSAEGEWVEKLAELELAGVNAQVAEAGKRAEIAESGAEMSSWPAVESEQAALARLEEEVLARGLALIDNSTQAQAQAQAQRGTAEVRFRVQALCDIGDACLALARIRARQASNAEAHGVLSIGDDMNGKGTHQAGLERAWELAARAAKMFTLALSALDTSSGSGTGAYAVLGASNTSTPTSRTRSAISYSLSSLSLLRTHPLLLRTIPASSNAHSQLLDNARVYARRAISECGLAWTLNARIGPEGRPPIQAASQDHAHGGWDSLRGEADALFGYVRALYGRWRAFSSSQPDSTSKSTNLDSTRTEMDAITCAIWALAHRSNDGGAWNLAVGSGGESATKQGVSRFLDELLSEEGQVSMDAGARAFWSGLDGRVREDRWASVWERLEGLEVGA